MGAKQALMARVEVLTIGETLTVFDFGDFGIIIEREWGFQDMKVRRNDGHSEVTNLLEAETGAGCEVPWVEILIAGFLEIRTAAMRPTVDLGEIDRLLKKYFNRFMLAD